MPRRTLAPLLSATVACLAAGALAACSDQSPVATGPAPGAALQVISLAQPVEGTGFIEFVPGSPHQVTLVAHVTDLGGNLAQGGVAVFEFCALKGGGVFGIPIGAPSATCESGSGRWVRAGTADVVAGVATLTFEGISTGFVLGFRFVYRGQGSGIGNFTSPSDDYTGV